MAACEDGPSAVQHLTREQKRSNYNHDIAYAQRVWQAFRDDLIRIGHQYFDYTAGLVSIKEDLHDAWDELIYIAKITPSNSSEHDRLLALVITVRELGSFIRRKKDAAFDGDEEAAVLPNGQRLWTDLPYLAHDFQNFWMNESTSLPVNERANLAVLTAKLCATGVCTVDLGRCALWLFKEALEKDRSGDESSKNSRSSLSELLPACIEWLNYSNFKLAKLSADNCNPATGTGDETSTSPGPLAIEANVTQQGFSVVRWLFWRQRLGELYISGDQEVSRSARKGFEIMALTGLAVGIQIPGEKKYLERLFEALDRELATLDGPGCVGPENIEIDPAWATEGDNTRSGGLHCTVSGVVSLGSAPHFLPGNLRLRLHTTLCKLNLRSGSQYSWIPSVMLCEFCIQHFNFSEKNLIQRVLRIKSHGREQAGRFSSFTTQDQEALALDFDRYREALKSYSGGPAPLPCCGPRPNGRPWPKTKTDSVVVHSGYETPLSGDLNVKKQNQPFHVVLESAKSVGCDLCSRLIHMIEYAIPDALPQDLDIQSSIYVGTFDCKLKEVRVFFMHRSALFTFKFDVLLDFEQNRPSLFQFEPRGCSNKGNETLDFLQQSFNTCINEHRLCMDVSSHGWIPTRLLNVSPHNEPNTKDGIRLEERGDIINSNPSSISYFTLSHMWGQKKALVLKARNYEELRRGIDLETLPTCFLDAVSITRRMGVKYLWIDSLCIIQDSEDDWMKEALVMSKVYRNSLCTIAACDSKGSEKTMFSNRNPTAATPFIVTQPFLEATAIFTVIPKWVDLMKEHSSLYSRGWVVQERFLSPRIMQIAKFPAWECCTTLQTEICPSGIGQDTDLRSTKSLGSTDRLLFRIRQNPKIDHSRFINSWWWSVVAIYSHTKFTHLSDKLIAIAGLAKEFSFFIERPYYAGIWGGEYLRENLLWKVNTTRSEVAVYPFRSKEYRAPSWSWAAVDVPVVNEYDEIHGQPNTDQVRFAMTIVSARTFPAKNDEFGLIVGGELVVKGRLFELPDIGPFVDSLSDTWIQLDDDPSTLLGKIIYFLPVLPAFEFEDSNYVSDGPIVAGILLQPVIGDRSNPGNGKVFSRIGFAEVSEDGRLVINDLADIIDISLCDGSIAHFDGKHIQWNWGEEEEENIIII